MQLNPEHDATGASSEAGNPDSGSGIGGFFRSLFGADDQAQYSNVYSESVRRGHYVLTVHTRSQHDNDIAEDILNRFNPIDIDERADQWRTEGRGNNESIDEASAPRYTEDDTAPDRTAYTSSSSTSSGYTPSSSANLSGEQRIPVVEENIQVSKRGVNRGGVRIFTRMRETPVNESVELREEHIKVERRPVDKAASPTDLDAFKEGTMEFRESSEEAVVNKSARVVEEVVVGKETTQRTETINDTVRRTDVDVEQLSASDSGQTADMLDDTEYRDHWKSNFGSSGGRYEDYASAYTYGSSMASSDRYQGSQWEDMEPQLRSDWESTHPGTNWDKVKDAVRYGTQNRAGNRR